MAAILRSPASFDGNEVAQLAATDGPVVFFPVRHHSPAAARHVQAFIHARHPRAVLIEGPSDFNPRLAELNLPHQLPIAIYSFARDADGRRRGAFYPFCDYSPEWQALRAANQHKIETRFIDLPWHSLVGADVPSHRYAEPQLQRSQYVRNLCEKLGVDDFDTAWDTLFEIDPALSLSDYLHRCHELCLRTRLLERSPRSQDVQREAYMAQQIQAVQNDSAPGDPAHPILVVTGGYHSSALWARVNGVNFPGVYTAAASALPTVANAEQDSAEQVSASNDPDSRGLALTPYSYSRLDNLNGYESGMPNPGFFHRLWHDRTQHAPASDAHRQLLADVANVLRQRGQAVSTADLIAVESTATALATVRSHAQVWRTDLIDGVLAALVKEEQAYGCTHPFLTALHEVLRGNAQGALAAGSAVPPLVSEVKEALAAWNLQPTATQREVTLDLTNGADLPQSQLLHRLRILGVDGFEQTDGTDLSTRSDLSRIWERWQVLWSPTFEASLIEASRYGAGLPEATLGRLEERAGLETTSADEAALMVLDAALAGVGSLNQDTLDRLIRCIQNDGSFISVSPALGHLLYLFFYDELFATAGRVDLAELLSVTFTRAVWLLETLGRTNHNPQHLLDAIQNLCDVFDRCQGLLTLDSPAFLELLQRIQQDTAQMPLIRGAVLGVQWSLGTVDQLVAERQLRQFAHGADVGDFLTGLFALARDVAPRSWDFLRSIDALLETYTDREFLEALPPLRLAFTYFTPREKHHLAMTLVERLKQPGGAPAQPSAVSPETIRAAGQLEAEVFDILRRYGLRGGEDA